MTLGFSECRGIHALSLDSARIPAATRPSAAGGVGCGLSRPRPSIVWTGAGGGEGVGRRLVVRVGKRGCSAACAPLASGLTDGYRRPQNEGKKRQTGATRHQSGRKPTHRQCQQRTATFPMIRSTIGRGYHASPQHSSSPAVISQTPNANQTPRKKLITWGPTDATSNQSGPKRTHPTITKDAPRRAPTMQRTPASPTLPWHCHIGRPRTWHRGHRGTGLRAQGGGGRGAYG